MATISLTSRPHVLVALGAMLPSLLGNRSGIGISWDSTDYMAVGLSMANRQGALDVTGAPMVIRPPGLSVFVTIGDWLTLSPDWSLRIVNAVSMFIIVWCTHHLLIRAGVRRVSRWLGVGLVAASPALLDIFTMAWSEPPFIALVMLALIIATRERTWPWDLLLAAVFTALFFIRYVGPFYSLAIAVVAGLVQIRASGFLLAGLRAGTSLAVSMVAPILWLNRNKEISGYLTGYREAGGGTLLDPTRTLTGTLGSWLIARPPLSGNGGIYLNWNDFSSYMKFAGVVVWILLFVLLLGFGLQFIRRKVPQSKATLVLALLWVFLLYVTFSIYRFVYHEMGPLDSRMMSGVYVPLILLFVIMIDELATSRVALRLVLAIGLIIVAWHGITTVRDTVRYGEAGRHWGTKGFSEVPIHQFVKDLPKDAAVYSNYPQSLFAGTFHWPIRTQYMYQIPYELPCSRRYFVWLNQAYLMEGKPVGGSVIYEDSWGQVIDLDACDTDIGRFWP